MSKSILKIMTFVFCLMMFTSPAKADIEAISAIIQYAVSLPGQSIDQLQKMATLYEKTVNLYYTGRDIYDKSVEAKEKIDGYVKKIEDIAEDPKGVAITFVRDGMKNIQIGGKETDVKIEADSMVTVKEEYSRTEGQLDNIAKQKEMNKEINKEKLRNSSVLFARSYIKRKELMEEEDDNPSLDTVSQAQKAVTDINITSAKRWNTILETQAYILSQKYLVEIQNYVNEAGANGGDE